MIELEQRGDVWVLRMANGENRFNRASVDALHAALDRLAAVDGPLAVVTTGEGKFYSNGLDLDWLLAGVGTEGFIDDFYRLLGRVLGFDAITVAAINGHAYAGGAMLAAAHDFTVMREDRGFWCLPEIDLGLPLARPLYEVVATRVPKATMAEASLTGRRYSSREALAAGIVTELAAEDAVLDRAVELAAALAGKPRDVLTEHKRQLHGRALAACGIT